MTKRAILTVTRNSSHIWKYFIKSFLDHVDRDMYDLYLYDNGSREGDVEYLNTYLKDETIRAAMFDTKNQLFTYSTNRLLEYCMRGPINFEERHSSFLQHIDPEGVPRYEQFVIVNPDIEFTKDWDKDLDENKGIMGFVLVKPDGTIEHAGAYGGGEHHGRGETDSPDKFTEIRDVDWVTFGAVAIHRGVIDLIGFMDEKNYPHFGSDREYCSSARVAGAPITCSSARLAHSYGYSTRPYVFRGVPEATWRAMVKERRDAGVYFPEDQEAIPNPD